MGRKPNRRKAGTKNRRASWWSAVVLQRRRQVLTGCAVLAALVVLVVSGRVAVARLDSHVNRVLKRQAIPELAFVDLPARLLMFAEEDLKRSAEDLLKGDWTKPDLCKVIAERLAKVGWVAEINYVRRTGTGRFEVSARFRSPTAMVQHDDRFYLVDEHAVRLPGLYHYDETWLLIQGVEHAAPGPGTVWAGGDVRAGLAVIDALAGKAFLSQITAVLVDNVLGRRDRHRTHLELATDRAGGRIRWGSAPGFEIEETSVAEKLAILTENYRQTGRVDAGHPVIDISLYADRFTIPVQ